MTEWRKYILGCAVGNLLEWYDFILFGFLATLFAKLFFPTENQFLSLLLTFGVFASGCLVRPFAGVFFGHFGDKYGRKKALICSIFLITVSTAVMGLLPTYQQVGVWAPILLVTCRIIQGIAVSGEEVGAAILLCESAPKNQQAFVGSIILSSVYGGLFLGALSVLIVTVLCTPAFFVTWGWRIPFILATFFGMFSLYLRIKTFESETFKVLEREKKILSAPLVELAQGHWQSVVRVICLSAILSVGIYLFAVYLPSYFTKIIGFNSLTGLIISSVFLLAVTLLVPVLGKMADHYGPERFMKLGCYSFLLLSYPIFYLLAIGTIASVVFAEMMLIICLALVASSVLSLVVNMFPAPVRYSGACIGFNISMTIFGSTAPIIALFLQRMFVNQTAPFIYLFAAALLSLIALTPKMLAIFALPIHFLNKQIHEEIR